MSDVPPTNKDCFWEILLRLSAESLGQLRRVCKAWRDIINDPSFIKSHTQNHYTHTLLVRNIDVRLGDVPLFSFSVDSLNAMEGSQTIEATSISDFERLDPLHAASCNGLFLLTDVVDGVRNWAMWNPLTWDRYEFSGPGPDVPTSKLSDYGFGYDDVSNDYKVVSVTPKNENENQTHIYSLKLGYWRAIQDSPHWVANQHGIPGAFLDGTFYWVPKSQDTIITLHIETESYSEFSIPPQLQGKFDLDHLSLDALDGFLILSFCPDDSHFEGWVVKDEGWDQLFYVEIPKEPFIVKLVAYLKDKRRILVHLDRGFLMLDVDKEDSLRIFALHGFPCIDSSRIFSKSLVRLNATLDNEFRGEKLEVGVRGDKDPCGGDGMEFGICKNCLGD